MNNIVNIYLSDLKPEAVDRIFKETKITFRLSFDRQEDEQVSVVNQIAKADAEALLASKPREPKTAMTDGCYTKRTAEQKREIIEFILNNDKYFGGKVSRAEIMKMYDLAPSTYNHYKLRAKKEIGG